MNAVICNKHDLSRICDSREVVPFLATVLSLILNTLLSVR